jgi:hypothetical protein
MSEHWSDEDLIDKLYGIGPDDAHLSECTECRARWLQFEARREEVLRPVEVAPELLGKQRKAIRNRIHGTGPAQSRRLAPALATMAVLVLGVMLSQPSPEPPTIAQNQANGDTEFFTEIYTMVESPTPWAAEPIDGLFEE